MSATKTRRALRKARVVALMPLFAVLPLLGCASSAPTAPRQSAASSTRDMTHDVAILDAFFGLDDAMPFAANALCPFAEGKDGMPVTFSRRIGDHVDPAAFRVTTRSGAVHTPRCATLKPALARSKRHTVLLIGDLGGEPADPPVRVDVTGSLPLQNGGDAIGLWREPVTPIADGPSVRIAYRYAPAALPESACPRPATKQIVQLTWGGGVTRAGGGELGDAERVRIHVTLAGGAVVEPAALADLGDHDNYTHLCLDSDLPATAVSVEPGVAVDPRGDPNTATSIAVTDDPEPPG